MSDKKQPKNNPWALVSGAIFKGKGELLQEDGVSGFWQRPMRLITADTILWAMTGGALWPREELKNAVELWKTGGTRPYGVFDYDHEFGVLAAIGRIQDYEYIEEGDEAFINCNAVLFTGKLPTADHARLLVETDTIRATSAEIAWETAVCSICGHKRHISNPEDKCKHIKHHSFSYYNGKPVYETMYNPVIVGACITREGADYKSEFLTAKDGLRLDVACFKKYEMSLTHKEERDDEMKNKDKIKSLEAEIAALKAKSTSLSASAEAETAETETEVETATEAETEVEASTEGGENLSLNADGEGETTESETEEETTTETDAEEGGNENKGAGFTDDQKDAVIEGLQKKIEDKEREIAGLMKQIDQFDELIGEYRWRLRRFEAEIVVDAMERKGAFENEDEKREMYWKLVDMTDSELEGVKVVYKFASTETPLALLEAKDKTGGKTTAAISGKTQAKTLTSRGPVPKDVGDILKHSGRGGEMDDDFAKAFAK